MHKRARHWSIWLQGAILLSILIGAAIWIFSAEQTPPGQADLKITVGELRSEAAEGRLLAEQVSAGNLTSTYLRTQTTELHENVDSARKELDSLKAGAGLEEKAAKAKALADALKSGLERLANSYQNAPEASAVGGDFSSLFSQLAELENGLKPQQ